MGGLWAIECAGLTLSGRCPDFSFAYRTGVGYARTRARHVAPCAGSGSGHLAQIFYSILSEHQAGLEAQRARATVFVLPLPLQVLLLFLLLLSFFGARGLVPSEVLELKGRRGELGKTDCESGYPKSTHLT